ncbi:MAG: hypothetical protein WBO70_00425 [Erysipelotrichaceae bacterium]
MKSKEINKERLLLIVGSVIKELRIKKGINIYRLSRNEKQKWFRMENCGHKLNIILIFEICQELDITPWEFVKKIYDIYGV